MNGGVEQLLKGNGVKIFRGTASFLSPQRVAVAGAEEAILEAKNVIIATGSTSAVPGLRPTARADRREPGVPGAHGASPLTHRPGRRGDRLRVRLHGGAPGGEGHDRRAPRRHPPDPRRRCPAGGPQEHGRPARHHRPHREAPGEHPGGRRGRRGRDERAGNRRRHAAGGCGTNPLHGRPRPGEGRYRDDDLGPHRDRLPLRDDGAGDLRHRRRDRGQHAVGPRRHVLRG